MTTDFELAVLEDGVVSDAEFSEAFGRFATCMDANGYGVEEQRYKGVYTGFFVPGDTDVPDSVVQGCYVGTLEYIEPLYHDMMVNPDNGDQLQSELECLQSRGILPGSMTVQEYFDSLNGGAGTQVVDQESEDALDCLHGI